MRKMIAFLLTLAILLPSVYAEDNIAAAVKIDNINSFINKIDEASLKLAINKPGRQIKAGLANIFLSENLAGIDTDRSLAIYMVLPKNVTNIDQIKNNPAPFIFALPVSGNGDDYYNSLTNRLGAPETSGQIHHFKDNNTPLKDIFVNLHGNYAIVAATEANLRQIKKHKKPSEIRPDLTSNVNGTIKIGIDIEAFLPLIESSVKSAYAVLESMPEQTGSLGRSMNPEAIIKAEVDLIMEIIRATKLTSMAVDLSEDTVKINSCTRVKRESKIAGILAIMSPISEKYKSLIPPDSPAIFITSGINAYDHVIDSYLSFMDQLYNSLEMKQQIPMEQIKKSMRDLVSLYSGEYAIGLGTNPENNKPAMIQVIAISDAGKTMEYINENILKYDETYEKIATGVSITPTSSRKYKKADIMGFDYDIDLQQAFAQQGIQGQPTPSWLSKLKFEIAVVDNNMIQIWGAPTVMNSIIDRITEHKTTDSSLTAALVKDSFLDMPEEIMSLYAISPLSVIKSLASAIPGMNQGILQALPDSRGGMAGYIRIDNNFIYSKCAISLNEIKAIRDSRYTLGGLLIQAMLAGAMPTQSSVPPDEQAKQICINNLRLLNAAKEQATLAKGLKEGDIVPLNIMRQHLPKRKIPLCPEGGTYRVNPIGTPPVCTVPSHSLLAD